MLETLTRELNPRYDTSRHRFDDTSLLAVVREPILLLANGAKSVVRGGCVGAALGYAISGALYLSRGDSNYSEHVLGMTVIGSGTDILQYSARFAFGCLKSMWNNKPSNIFDSKTEVA